MSYVTKGVHMQLFYILTLVTKIDPITTNDAVMDTRMKTEITTQQIN